MTTLFSPTLTDLLAWMRGRPQVVFWHQVDDPCSHILVLALHRLVDKKFDLRIEVVPEPAADVDPEPALRMSQSFRDAPHWARALGVPYRQVVSSIASDRVRRAQALLLVQRSAEEWLGIAEQVGAALFEDDGKAIASLVQRYGVIAGVDVRPRLAESYASLRAAGHFYGGTLSLGREHFAGPQSFREFLRAARLPELPKVPAEPLTRRRVDVFLSYTNPEDYVALLELKALPQSVDVVVSPSYDAVFETVGVSETERKQSLHSCKRRAATLGYAMRASMWPSKATVRLALSGHAAAEQRLGAAAASEVAFLLAQSIWGEGRELDEDHVNRLISQVAVARGIGLAEPPMLAGSAHLERANANHAVMRELGLWRTPAFDLGDERFVGCASVPRIVERALPGVSPDCEKATIDGPDGPRDPR